MSLSTGADSELAGADIEKLKGMCKAMGISLPLPAAKQRGDQTEGKDNRGTLTLTPTAGLKHGHDKGAR
jgi:hypothetical protein